MLENTMRRHSQSVLLSEYLNFPLQCSEYAVEVVLQGMESNKMKKLSVIEVTKLSKSSCIH